MKTELRGGPTTKTHLTQMGPTMSDYGGFIFISNRHSHHPRSGTDVSAHVTQSLTQEGAGDELGDLVPRSAHLRQVGQLPVQHSLELKDRKEREGWVSTV